MNKEEIWNTVDRILWKDWDPIGVNDYGGPSDEYKSYVSSIVKLIEEQSDESEIAKQLHYHANINMGVSSTLHDHLEVASKLKKLAK